MEIIEKSNLKGKYSKISEKESKKPLKVLFWQINNLVK
jgi:hypothetical protein